MANHKPKKTFQELSAQKTLPNRIVGIFNPDKDRDHVRTNWTKDDRNPLKLPVFRMILAGPPGVGKTTVIQNLLLHNKFRKIWVVTGSKYTEEWDNIPNSQVLVNKLPPERKLVKPNRCLILDDISFGQWSKKDKNALEYIFRNISSHHGLSVCISSQVFMDIPPTIRRCANIFVLWKTPDMIATGKEIFKRAGLEGERSTRLFNLLDESMHHSITLDMIPGLNKDHPIGQIRFNLTDKVIFEEDKPKVEESKRK